MKYKLVLTIAFILLIAFLSGAQADFKKIKIAVLDFQLQGKGFETEDMGQIVSEWLITAFVKEGRFEVVERRLLNKLLDEQKLVMTGMIDESSATQLGKMLGVKVIIAGSVMKLQKVIEVNARIIDVESASIIAAETIRSTTAMRLENLMGQMAEKIIKDFPLEGYVVNRHGNTVTIDLGKLAGVKKTMKFIVFREGQIIKHPKTGEVLDVEHIQTGIIEIDRVRKKISTGTIIDEEVKDPIEYGQLVKNVTEPTEPMIDESIEEPVQQQVVTRPKPKPATTSTLVERQVKMLQSSDPLAQRQAAKAVFNRKIQHPILYKVMADELMKGYRMRRFDKYKIDALAWMIKAIATSGLTEYREVLQKVARESDSQKLRKYAMKFERQLR
jgi:TolB-like protein